jgi:hypothetical protein
LAFEAGKRSCAVAAVDGTINTQTYELIRSDDPDLVINDVVLHLDVRVRRVLFGPIYARELKVSGVAHTLLAKGRWRFYLKRARHGQWSIADCIPSR